MLQGSNVAQGEALKELDKRSVVHPYSALHTQAKRDVIVWESAKGIILTDDNGNEYLDAAAGLWCTNVGYGRRTIVEAAAAQMEKTSSVHAFAQFSNEPLILLTDRLLRLAPDDMRRILYGNSGSDANDTQIKLVRRYSNVRGKPQKKKIIARSSGYHGSTIGSGSLSGIPLVHRTFDLPIEGVLHTHAPDYYRRPDHITSEEEFVRWLADELDAQIMAEGPDTVAAFIAEPITGAGGVIVPPKGYFRAINEVLRKHDVLMIADEVITAFGRTGSWFASPYFEVEPDLITISKGLTSGYFPMSACLISEKVCDVLYAEESFDGFFGHGFTASGHSVAAATALANIDIIEGEELPRNAEVVGEYLLARLQERIGGHEIVGDIRGKGLMIGIEFDQDKNSRQPFDDPGLVGSILSQASLDEKLIVRGGHGRVLAALAPPLIITKADADEIVTRMERVVDRVATKLKALGIR